jgi:putative glutathione S-transferase
VDVKRRRIVSNESKDIVRMLPLLAELKSKQDKKDEDETTITTLVPAELKAEIEETNGWVYRLVNNGVYRCGLF